MVVAAALFSAYGLSFWVVGVCYDTRGRRHVRGDVRGRLQHPRLSAGTVLSFASRAFLDWFSCFFFVFPLVAN